MELHVSGQRWGRADNLRYDCCFIWVDVSLPALDKYVDQRVDDMINAGLLNEVYDIYNPDADYTRGLRQAIGVREFEKFLRCYLSNPETCHCDDRSQSNGRAGISILAKHDKVLLSDNDENLKILLSEAINRMKANTRRLVRRQRRRLNRLRSVFGWDLHYIDATEAFLCNSGGLWMAKVVEPCVNLISSFLHDESTLRDSKVLNNFDIQISAPRDLWTQYICEACGNRVLRGAYEWEQHKQGRRHRKRVSSLRMKSQIPCLVGQQQHLKSTECLK